MSYKILLIVMVLFPFAFSQSNVKIPTTTTKGSYVSFNQYNDSLKDSIKSFQIGNAWKVIGKCVLDTNKDLTLFVNKGKFYGNTGSSTDTLVINKMSADPAHQIFDTSITVQFASGAVPAVRPEWWGAKGDSVTIDSTAIKITIASLPYGGKIQLAPGVYRCGHSTFSLPSNISLIGVKGKTKFLWDGIAGNLYSGILLTNVQDVLIDGVSFDNTIVVGDTFGMGRQIELLATDSTKITRNITFQNCTFSNASSGMEMGKSVPFLNTGRFYNVKVINCSFYRMWKHGWASRCCDGFLVSNCYGYFTKTGLFCDFSEGTRNGSMVNCRGDSLQGFFKTQTDDPSDSVFNDRNLCKEITVSNCVFRSKPELITEYMIRIAGNNVILNGNYFKSYYNNYWRPLVIIEGGSTTITNNQFVIDSALMSSTFIDLQPRYSTHEPRRVIIANNYFTTSRSDSLLGIAVRGIFSNVFGALKRYGDTTQEYISFNNNICKGLNKIIYADSIKVLASNNVCDYGATFYHAHPETFYGVNNINGKNKLSVKTYIDTIGANSIIKEPTIDTIYGLNALRGNPNIDSASGNTKWTGAVRFNDSVAIGGAGPLCKFHIQAKNFDGSSSGVGSAGLLIDSDADGSGVYTAGLGFKNRESQYGAPRALIVGKQTSTDSDILGLSFFIHSSGTSLDPLNESMILDTFGLSIDSSIWCGKNLHVTDSAHAVNAVKTNRLYYGIASGDSLQIGASGSVIKQFWKDGDSLKVLIGADTLAWKPD